MFGICIAGQHINPDQFSSLFPNGIGNIQGQVYRVNDGNGNKYEVTADQNNTVQSCATAAKPEMYEIMPVGPPLTTVPKNASFQPAAPNTNLEVPTVVTQSQRRPKVMDQFKQPARHTGNLHSDMCYILAINIAYMK